MVEITFIIHFKKSYTYKFNYKNFIMNFVRQLHSIMTIKKPLVIALQGTSSFFNYRFANFIENELKNKNINTLKIDTENYRIIDNYPNQSSYFDFYNQSTYNWDLMRKTIDDLANKNRAVHMSKFKYPKYTSEPYFIRNTYPDVIIVYGPFAFNIFDYRIFGMTKNKHTRSYNQIVDVPYVVNPKDYFRYFHVKKILFFYDKEKKLELERESNYYKSYFKDLINKRENFDSSDRTSISSYTFPSSDNIDFYFTDVLSEDNIKEALLKKINAWLYFHRIDPQDVEKK